MKLHCQNVKINRNKSILQKDCHTTKSIAKRKPHFQIDGEYLNPLSASPTKWLNTLKQFVGNLPTNCLSVFVHFVRLALKGLNWK